MRGCALLLGTKGNNTLKIDVHYCWVPKETIDFKWTDMIVAEHMI